MKKRKHINPLPIIDYSGFNPKPGCIPFAKKHEYFVVTNISITGDAPKDFIRYYQFKRDTIVRKSNPDTWKLYLAKHGHKHYPMEAITEYLLNQIGEVLGFNMAKSGLLWLGNQIRFISEYFIERQDVQYLDHGADLYAGYLHDREFVEEIENTKQSATFFTVQFTEDTLKHFFPRNYKELMGEFLKLLIFDALIGNNDRHYYNWGIVRHIEGTDKPYFSPIYDTARGLFWNDHEEKIREITGNKNRFETFIRKYAEGSCPKIGWEDAGRLNHFELVEKIATMREYSENCTQIKNICDTSILDRLDKLIDVDFGDLISTERKIIIKECLKYRHNRIREIFLALQHD